ncbi:hypothetical protein Q2100_14730, partial [Mycolicibacterium sp. KC 300]|nr:hypothetical protein [Mycolicibacterium arseniciresistens]
RIPTRGAAPAAPHEEPPTTRFSAAKNAVRGAIGNAPTQRVPRATPPAQQREEREIESWLGELRGRPAGGAEPGQPPRPPQPSADPTRAMRPGGPRVGNGTPRTADEGNEPTTAIPTPRQRQQPKNPDATTAIPTPRTQDPASTEKIDTRESDDEQQRRRGGGMSAADLLRREGRL